MRRYKVWSDKKRSNLSLNVHTTECSSFGRLEESNTFAGEEVHLVILLLLGNKKVIGIVVHDELCRLLIGHESKLLGNESKFDFWLVSAGSMLAKRSTRFSRPVSQGAHSRFANIAQSSKTLSTDKHVHQVPTENRWLLVKLEEAMVVARGQGRADIESVLNGGLGFLCSG